MKSSTSEARRPASRMRVDFFWGLDMNGHGRTRVSPVLRKIGGERFVFQGQRILVQIGRRAPRRMRNRQRLERAVFPMLK
jgi:hypothetical protein